MNVKVIALVIVLIAGLGAAGLFFFKQSSESSLQTQTSDLADAKGTITIGVDSFVGYFLLCSPYMKQTTLQSEYLLNCVDDQADYAKRFDDLRRGRLDFAVGTVDSYVLGGQRTNYPGAIVSVIDESTGGDAIVARENVVSDLTELKDREDVKTAFTPDSPSHHFLKAAAVHFDVSRYKDADSSWKVESDGSGAARDALVNGQADVAVLWEPDVSKVLSEPGYVKLLGSEMTSKLIVDILIVNRDYLEDHRDRVDILLANLFKTQKYYRDNPDKLVKDVAKYSGTNEDVAEQMLKGISWVNLNDNATKWFGVPLPGQAPVYGLMQTIDGTVELLSDFGDMSTNPFPNGDARVIISSDPIRHLHTAGVGPSVFTSVVGNAVTNPLEADFPPTSPEKWNNLKEVGTLKVRPIRFQSGNSGLSLEDKRELDEAAKALENYPHFWIEVQGHSKPGGDEEANRTLSESRAQAVERYLKVTYGIDSDRIRAVGFGSNKPLKQKPGEKFRAYQGRLARVEIHLMQEEY